MTATQAIAAYEATVSPANIRKIVRAARACGPHGLLITPAVIRESAADTLREALGGLNQ